MNDHQCSGRCRREGCPNCPHGRGDEEHCDVCDKVTKALKESDEKPRWSQCNDCFDGDHNKCSGGICACSLVHPEHHPMNESKPQDWEKYIGYEFEKCAGPHCNHETSDEHLFVTVEAMKDALTHGYQEGVKAGEKRALEWVLKDVDLSSSSVEQIANRLDTPENQ